MIRRSSKGSGLTLAALLPDICAGQTVGWPKNPAMLFEMAAPT
jgi:hypothetical protein